MTHLWSAKARIGPLHFQARCRRRRLNLALVFLCLFVLYVSSDWWMRAFVMLGLVFPHQAKRLAWGTSPKWPILCWVGRKTLTQSILQAREGSVDFWKSCGSFLISSDFCNDRMCCSWKMCRLALYRVPTPPGKFWKVLIFSPKISRPWKLLEFTCGSNYTVGIVLCTACLSKHTKYFC